jgi:hypothetical protein
MKILWKIYAIIYLVIILLVSFSDLTDSSLHLIDYIDVIVSMPTVLAVIGWAWKKKIGTQALWGVYTPLFFCVDIVYNLFLDNHTPEHSLIGLIAVLLLLFPGYLATLLYTLNFEVITLQLGQNISPITLQSTNPANQVMQANVATTTLSGAAPQVDISSWNMGARSQPEDPQLAEIKRMQAVNSSRQAVSASLAQEAQASYDYKIEAEQLGKWPWMRWYSHPVVGRDVEKGITDIIFLSLFGNSSATDNKYTRTQRAIIRTILTLAIVAVLSQLGHYLLKT